MKVHPVISIILGTIAAIILPIISMKLFSGSVLGAVVIPFVIFIIGGFIATYFAKEKKIRYGFYEGIILAIMELLILIAAHTVIYTDFLLVLIGTTFMILLPASIGGFLGKMTEENSRQTFKIKYLNRNLHPIIAIIMGIFVTFVCYGLLGFIAGVQTSFGVTNFVVGTISITIGGFIATYFAKEKKIRYGIYVWLIFIIISLLIKLYREIHGINTQENYYILIGTIAGYLLAATIGSYLGKVADEHLKQKSEKSAI